LIVALLRKIQSSITLAQVYVGITSKQYQMQGDECFWSVIVLAGDIQSCTNQAMQGWPSVSL